MRTVTVGSSDTVAAARVHADLVITPPDEIGLIDWKALPRVVELGRHAARAALNTSLMKRPAVLMDPAPRTFFGVPRAPDLEMLDAQVAFLGVPYDGGTPQPGIPTGQRAGPAAAREASVDQFSYPRLADPGDDHGAEGWYDVEADRDYLVGVRMADVGDVAIQGSDTQANYERITSAARGVVQRGALLVAIGGDHSISYPLGRGMEPLGEFDVVHVDAHTDALDTLDGARLTGASQLRRLAELPFVATVTALGVRNVDRAEVDGIRALGGRWATTLEVLERGAGAVVRETVPETGRLYVSIDLDVLDSSVAPGHSLSDRARSATASFACSWARWRDTVA